MAFRNIQKGVQRRLSALKKETSFSQYVLQIMATLYPRVRTSVSRIVHEPRNRRIRIYTTNKSAANKFAADKKLIHAALRREGVDVREVIVR